MTAEPAARPDTRAEAPGPETPDDAGPSGLPALAGRLVAPLWSPPGVATARGRAAYRAAYGLLGVATVSYVVSVVARGPGGQRTWLDGWTVGALEAATAVVLLTRALRPRPGRGAGLLLGVALLSWAAGDLALAAESGAGAQPSVPSVADPFYLGFYVVAYVALFSLLRRQSATLAPRSWIDGAIAGMGAAAFCASFAIPDIVRVLHASGGALAVATNLAYPVGDLLLLALVVAGAAIVPAGARTTWSVLAVAMVLNAVGDTFNLFGTTSVGRGAVGVTANAVAWPVSILLMSVAAWAIPSRGELHAEQRPPGFALPGVASCAGLCVLVVGSVHPVSRAGTALAAATLVLVGLRLSTLVRTLRNVTVERHRQSVTDELTALGNRRQLFGVLDAFFAEQAAGEGALAFLFIDLNRFKEINDSFGHPAGDELLRQLGPRLKASLRPGDVIVRLGGDEFAVVLAGVDAEQASRVAARLSAIIATPFAIGEVRAQISASIGIALAPGDASDSAGLVWCADVAMYRAKFGRIPFALYDQALDDGGDHLRLAGDLRAAVEAGAFVMHYQPQLDLATGKVAAVEALLRWPHPELGLVPPLKFLPLAEEAGLMRPLTLWVLDAALRQCAEWRASGHELAVSVNVSATDLLEPGLVEAVAEALARHDVPPSQVVLEITETSIISDFDRSRRVIEGLRGLGLVVSIDDFGAGFTSLAYLRGLPVGELKLDRTFVTDLAGGDKPRDLELVRATIELGHAMGLRVVAEGIEDDATLRLLSELGCDLAQGYFIGRPMPAPDLAFRAEMQAREPAPAVGA